MSKRHKQDAGGLGRPGSIRRQLTSLREDLAAGRWPEGADRLLAHLAPPAPPVAGPDAHEMLAIVAGDALEGVEVATRYPRFYGRLLADPDLRAAFLDALAILEATDRLPAAGVQPAGEQLAFLQEPAAGARPAPTLAERLQAAWPVRWQTPVSRLEQLFGLAPAPGAGLAWRGPGDATAPQEAPLLLLRDHARVGERELEIMLEGTLEEEARQLRPSLLVAGVRPDQTLTVSVRWGHYAATAPLSADGEAHLPPIPLDEIFDQGQVQPLRVELSPAV